MFQAWVGSITMAVVSLMSMCTSRIIDGPDAPWSTSSALSLSVLLVALASLVEMTISLCLNREGIVRGWVRRQQE